MTAMEWIRQQNRPSNVIRIDSSVPRLLSAIDLRDKALRLNIGGQVMQAEGLINARAREVRERVIRRAFYALCEA